MHSNHACTLVLTLAAERNGRDLFIGDLYAGGALYSSVQHTRAAMIQWIGTVDAAAQHGVAKAMDQLAANPSLEVRVVTLNLKRTQQRSAELLSLLVR